jgi:hypothetical protein
MIYPVLGIGLRFGWPEISFAVFFLAGGLLWVRWIFTRGADMPIGDPFLRKGLEFHL